MNHLEIKMNFQLDFLLLNLQFSTKAKANNADNIRNAIKTIKQEDICAFQPNGKILGDRKGIRYNIEQFEYLVNNSLEIEIEI